MHVAIYILMYRIVQSLAVENFDKFDDWLAICQSFHHQNFTHSNLFAIMSFMHGTRFVNVFPPWLLAESYSEVCFPLYSTVIHGTLTSLVS